jgi:hypothetical protein
MCCGIESSNLLFGRSYTPYDTRYTSGGSSGGEVISLTFIDINKKLLWKLIGDF